MLVRNLTSWAGPDFSHGFGVLIDLPDAIALDRIAAGLCEAVEAVAEVTAPPPAKRRGKMHPSPK